jgi:hypothetical protein
MAAGYLIVGQREGEMREADFLFTIAEVGTAFAGFATLVVVFSQRFGGPQGEVERIRLSSMLRVAVLAVLFSLLPYLPFYFGLATESAWRVCAGLLSLTWLAYYVFTLRIILATPEALARLRPSNRLSIWLIQPLGFGVLLLTAAGLWSEYTSHIYLASIFVLLALSVNLFVQLVSALSEE